MPLPLHTSNTKCVGVCHMSPFSNAPDTNG